MKFNLNTKKKALANTKALFVVSGRPDSNWRPLAPHTSALPGCATSRTESKIKKNHPNGHPFNYIIPMLYLCVIPLL